MADTKEELICPACNKPMVKVDTSASVSIDICLDGCGGVWFDNRELEKFDEEKENADDITNALKGKVFKRVDENEERYCPVCKTKMVKHKASFNCDVEIDECYNCGGKFLDNKELEKIRESKPTTKEQIDNIVNAIYYENNTTPYVAKKNPRRDIVFRFCQKFFDYK